MAKKLSILLGALRVLIPFLRADEFRPITTDIPLSTPLNEPYPDLPALVDQAIQACGNLLQHQTQLIEPPAEYAYLQNAYLPSSQDRDSFFCLIKIVYKAQVLIQEIHLSYAFSPEKEGRFFSRFGAKCGLSRPS